MLMGNASSKASTRYISTQQDRKVCIHKNTKAKTVKIQTEVKRIYMLLRIMHDYISAA